jgi:hypothetical protein
MLRRLPEKHMRPAIFITAMSFLLVSCASGVYDKPGGTQEEAKLTFYECQRDSEMRVGQATPFDLYLRPEHIKECMAAHGWNKIK